jgi:hypothetical protein
VSSPGFQGVSSSIEIGERSLMISYIPADEQRTIMCEIEEARNLVQQVFLRLKPLARTDQRVTRAEEALSALERLLWTTTSGPGRLGPPTTIRAILTTPGSSSESGRNGKPFLVASPPPQTGIKTPKEVQRAHALAD